MEPAPRRRRNLLKGSIVATLACAILIDAYLCVTHGLIFKDATPLQVSQWDASNVLGRAAFSGGLFAGALGFALHLAVSACWATAYVLAAARIRSLVERPFLWGALYGIAVMFAMRYLVVPLGHATLGGSTAASFTNVVIAHVAFFGIPVAPVARRYV